MAWLCAGVLIAMHVRAEGEPLELEWNAPKGCPTQDDVLAEVRRIVGTGEVRRHVHAVAQVSGDADHWSLALRTEEGGSGGERTLDGHSCKAVASAAALVLALTLQTDPAPIPSVTASVSVPPPATTTPPPQPKTRISPLLRAGGGLALSGVPGIAGLATVELGARYGRFEGDITFAFLSQTSQTAPNAEFGGPYGGQFTHLGIGALACIAPVVPSEMPSVEVWGCVGGEVGWLGVRGLGTAKTLPFEDTYTYFSPVISPRLTWAPLRRVALVLESTFSFPLETKRFFVCRSGLDRAGKCPVGGDVTIFSVPPAEVRVALAVELRF